MKYFKSGARKEEGRMGPIARAVSDEDVREAAAYFAAIKPAPFVKVIETATPPKTYVSADARHRRIHPDGGDRADRPPHHPDSGRSDADDNPRSAFGVHRVRAAGQHRQRAPRWRRQATRARRSSARSATATRSRGSARCRASPGLQPVYIARQLITMQNGTSAGANAALMKKVVAKLSEDDIIALSAYLGSLPPK